MTVTPSKISAWALTAAVPRLICRPAPDEFCQVFVQNISTTAIMYIATEELTALTYTRGLQINKICQFSHPYVTTELWVTSDTTVTQHCIVSVAYFKKQAGQVPAAIGVGPINVEVIGARSDTGTGFTSVPTQPVSAINHVLNFGVIFEPVRTPNTFKLANAAAIGSTALWTPAAGKKFRILGFSVFIPSISTSAAGSVVSLLDNAAAFTYAAAIGATTAVVALTVALGPNGFLSAAANNVLNISLSAAFTAGAIYVSAWGTEE